MKKAKNLLLNKSLFHIAFGLMMLEIAGAINYMIDGIVTSRWLDETAMAANGITGPIFAILSIFSGVFASGFQNIAGIQLGEGRSDVAKNTWRITWVFALFVSSAMMVVGLIFSDGIASLLGAPVSMMKLHTDSAAYIRGFMIGAVPYIFSALFIPALQINGKNKLITVSVIALSAVDILGDFANVFIFHGGMFGMGLATSLSYFVSAAILLSGLLDRNAFMDMHLARYGSDERGTLRRILLQGLPKATKRVCNTLRPIFINRFTLAAAGEAAMVAMSVEGNTRFILESPGIGISGAALMLVGILLGEMDYQSLREMQKKCQILIWGGVGLLGLIYFLMAEPLTRLYISPDSQSFAMTVTVLRCHAVSLPFLAFNEYYFACFQGMGKLVVTHMFTAMQRFVCIVALSYGLQSFFGIDGIFYAIPLSEVLVSILVLVGAKLIIPLEKLKKPDFYGDISQSLFSKEEFPAFLDSVDAFFTEYGIEERNARYVRLFIEEIGSIVLSKGFEDGKAHQLDVRILYTKEGLSIRTKDDCLTLSDIECSDKSIGTPEDPLLGLHMVFTLAKNVQYTNTMNMNHLLIQL